MISQYFYTSSCLSTVIRNTLISIIRGCQFLFSLQEDRGVCRHPRVLIGCWHGICPGKARLLPMKNKLAFLAHAGSELSERIVCMNFS